MVTSSMDPSSGQGISVRRRGKQETIAPHETIEKNSSRKREKTIKSEDLISTTKTKPVQKNSSKKTKEPQDDSEGDVGSIFLLLVLYTLQGIPMGLSSSIPFILQGKVGYDDQATFSLVSWPFSLKLLWAPFVDSIYCPSFGRRKSWLVPVQFLCAAMMIFGSYIVDDLLGGEDVQGGGNASPPHVVYLTIFFFLLYVLMATQDIAVDGWALTMLSEKNVTYASTCNSVGQTVGYFMAYVGFLALHDPDTCNSYFRSEPVDYGMVTLPSFMAFWGWVMFATTLVVWFFKPEKEDTHKALGVRETYHQIYTVLQLPCVISLVVILLTSRIGFAAVESVAALKLVEYGMKKEDLALLTPVLVPLGIVIPIFLSKFGSSPKPLRMFLWGYPFRLVVGLLYAAIVWYTPLILSNPGHHYYYYLIILFSGALHELAANMMSVSMISFFARISDPRIGGTYMTLLNTLTNLGAKWPMSMSLAFVDHLTFRECTKPSKDGLPLACDDLTGKSLCVELEGTCNIRIDGFFVEIAISTILGILWLIVFYRRVDSLHKCKAKEWRVRE